MSFYLILSGLGLIPLKLLASPISSEIDFSLYEDKNDALTIDQVREIDREGGFIPRKTFGRNGLGFTHSAVWLKFTYDFRGGKNRYYLGSPRPDFTTMDAYLFQPNGELQSFSTIGTRSPRRELKTRLPVGSISFAAPGTYTFYVKVKSSLQLSLSFFLVSEQEYIRQATNEANFYFLYYGVVLGLLLYNLCLFFILKSRDYLFYIAFGISMLMNAYVQGGFPEVSSFPIPGFTSTEDALKILFFPCITSLLFTISFLNLRTLSPRLVRAMLGIAALAFGFQLTLWIDKDSSVKNFTSLCDMIAVLSVFTGSITAIRAGDKVARIFLLAWGLLAACVGVWLLGNLGILEKNYVVALAPIAGNMTEMILMSMALAMRIRDIKAKRMIAELKAKEKEHLQHLLRIVCHDISNPLSVIKSVVHVSKRREALEAHHMQRVQRATESIEGIIRQVRKYEAYRSGKLNFELKPCSVKKAFDDIEFYFAEAAANKNIELRCGIRGADDLEVMAEEISFSHEVLNNLISNALKFTQPGGRVQVSAWAEHQDVYIQIEDNGLGIPDDLLPRIFATDGPTTRLGTREEVGSGFGMPLVKIFVELFRGSITIDSRTKEKSHDPGDHGTRIIIRLDKAKT